MWLAYRFSTVHLYLQILGTLYRNALSMLTILKSSIALHLVSIMYLLNNLAIGYLIFPYLCFSLFFFDYFEFFICRSHVPNV